MNNKEKFINLRKDYPVFSYDSYKVTESSQYITIQYLFDNGAVQFNPKIIIKKNKYIINNINSIEHIAFLHGMFELVSYWKATCSPKILIKPYNLSNNLTNFFKKLYFLGLGEFRYLNNIHDSVSENEFFDFVFIDNKQLPTIKINGLTDNKIIPVGGGKDSSLTLDILSKFNTDNNICLSINPSLASYKTIEISKCNTENIIEIKRTIDKNLIKLNQKGFLNGHTPFSSVVASLSIIISSLTNSKYIVLSNESSANETTVYNSEINHQYSKTIQFEKDLQQYIKENISDEMRYFSILRPLNELQIAFLFSKLKQYHTHFRSCNNGSKINSWCCNCAKCLFTYIILSPFIQQKELVKIFGKNLLEKEELQQTFNQLIGISAIKPFECVGTREETNIAIIKTIEILNKKNKKLPLLLKYYDTLNIKNNYQHINFNEYMHHINNVHCIPVSFSSILAKYLEKNMLSLSKLHL